MQCKMDMLSIVANHGGKFVNKEGCSEHVGGSVTYFNISNIETLTFIKLHDMVEKLCVDEILRLFCRIYAFNKNLGIMLIYEDKQLKEMVKFGIFLHLCAAWSSPGSSH